MEDYKDIILLTRDLVFHKEEASALENDKMRLKRCIEKLRQDVEFEKLNLERDRKRLKKGQQTYAKLCSDKSELHKSVLEKDRLKLSMDEELRQVRYKVTTMSNQLEMEQADIQKLALEHVREDEYDEDSSGEIILNLEATGQELNTYAQDLCSLTKKIKQSAWRLKYLSCQMTCDATACEISTDDEDEHPCSVVKEKPKCFSKGCQKSAKIRYATSEIQATPQQRCIDVQAVASTGIKSMQTECNPLINNGVQTSSSRENCDGWTETFQDVNFVTTQTDESITRKTPDVTNSDDQSCFSPSTSPPPYHSTPLRETSSQIFSNPSSQVFSNPAPSSDNSCKSSVIEYALKDCTCDDQKMMQIERLLQWINVKTEDKSTQTCLTDIYGDIEYCPTLEKTYKDQTTQTEQDINYRLPTPKFNSLFFPHEYMPPIYLYGGDFSTSYFDRTPPVRECASPPEQLIASNNTNPRVNQERNDHDLTDQFPTKDECPTKKVISSSSQPQANFSSLNVTLPPDSSTTEDMKTDGFFFFDTSGKPNNTKKRHKTDPPRDDSYYQMRISPPPDCWNEIQSRFNGLLNLYTSELNSDSDVESITSSKPQTPKQTSSSVNSKSGNQQASKKKPRPNK